MKCLFGIRSKLFLGGLFHFLMEKVIDYHGRLPESCAMLIVVTQIGHSRAGSVLAHFLIQLAPVRPIPLGIDGVVQLIQFRVMLMDPVQNPHTVVAPEIQRIIRKSCFPFPDSCFIPKSP